VRVWVDEKPGPSGAAFFDLYTDPREESGEMLPTFPAKGMLTLYAGAKSPGVDRESNWLPASGPFALYIRAYWAGEPHLRWSVETAACQASTIGQLTTACATWFRDANEDDIERRLLGAKRILLRRQLMSAIGGKGGHPVAVTLGRRLTQNTPNQRCRSCIARAPGTVQKGG
jgi:hypothetical protein